MAEVIYLTPKSIGRNSVIAIYANKHNPKGCIQTPWGTFINPSSEIKKVSLWNRLTKKR